MGLHDALHDVETESDAARWAIACCPALKGLEEPLLGMGRNAPG